MLALRETRRRITGRPSSLTVWAYALEAGSHTLAPGVPITTRRTGTSPGRALVPYGRAGTPVRSAAVDLDKVVLSSVGDTHRDLPSRAPALLTPPTRCSFAAFRSAR